MRRAVLAVLAAVCLHSVGASAGPCSGHVPCTVEGGSYLIELPSEKVKGVYVFFHGYRSSAELQMRHRALVEVAHDHGLAFVAVDGLRGTWSHPNAPGHYRDEGAFVTRVLDDVDKRFGFDRSNTLVGGFSQGASMAWYTLCQSGDRLAGAVTFSGVFWNPLPKPEDCVADLPPIIHFHGRRDGTFPLAGRAIGRGFHQGDTFQSIAIMRAAAECNGDVPAIDVADLSCSMPTDCVRGDVALCLHDGGHQITPEYLDIGLTKLGF